MKSKQLSIPDQIRPSDQVRISGRTPGNLQVISRLLLALVALTAFAFLGGCEINKPEMPTFDTSVAIPLGVERIEVLDLVEDEEFLVVGSDSSLGFFIDGDPDTIDFDFELAADFGSQHIQQGLGNFELPDLDPMAYNFQLSDLWAPADGLVNQPAIVPAFPFSVTSSGQDLPDIESATLSSGSVSITVTNGLPVPVSAASGHDQVILNMIDPGSGTSFASFTFPVIAPGGSSTQTADLSGVNLPGEVAVTLAGGSPGSTGSLVTVNGTDTIAVSANFTDLVVSSATALVEAQNFQTSFDTELPADYEITHAIISSGTVGLTLANDMPIPCTSVVTWPNLVNLSGQALSEIFVLAAGETATRAIDFSGYILEANSGSLTVLSANVDITTPGSGTTPVTMNATDGLTADISGGSIAFDSVTGIVPAYEVALDPMEEEIDLPDEMDGIELTSASMVLRLTNSAGLPGDLDLMLSGTSASGQVRTMDVSRTIAPALDRAPQVTNIVLTENNSTIVDFLNNLPETITLSGDVQVGGDGSEGTVRADDYAVVAWDVSAPMEVIISGSTIAGDPELIDLDEDMRDMIEDHALGAHIQTEILNHMPLGVELRILAGTDAATLESNPLLTVGPLTVEGALVDPQTHTVAEPVISWPVVQLTEEQARIFALPNLLTAVEVVLPSTNGNPIRMMATDYLEVRGIVNVDVHVNDEW